MISSRPDPPAWPRPGYAWYVVTVLSLAYAVAFIDRMILNLLIEPIRVDLALSDTSMGLLSGASFALFYVTLGVPIGRLADRRNRRNIIAVGMTLWSLMTAACGLSRSFWQLFVFRMGVGVGEAALSPSATSMISDYFPPHRLARGMAVYSSGVSFGIGLSLLVGGAVYTAAQGIDFPDLPVIGIVRPWQVAFLLVSVPGLLLAALMVTVREPLRKGLSASAAAADGVSMGHVWHFITENRRTFISLFVTFSMTSVLTYGSSAWMSPFFMRTHGWTVGEVGWTYGWMMLLCGPCGTLAGGWITDLLRQRGYLDACLRTTCAAMLLLLPLASTATLIDSEPAMLVALALFWFVASVPLSLGYAAVQDLAPNEMRGTLAAVLLFVVTLAGMGLGPTIIAVLTDFVFSDPAALPLSIAITASLAAAVAAMAAWYGCGGLRMSIEAKTH